MFKILVFCLFFGLCLAQYQEQKCANAGGVCKNENSCSGQKLVGYCPTQPRSVKCCVPSSSSTSSVKSNDCGCGYQYAGTKCSGGETAGARRLADHLKAKFGGTTSIYNCRNVRGGSRLSLHAEGRAVDLMISGAKGHQAFDYAISIACTTGIQEVIFNRKIWTSSKGIHPYTGTNPHTDHVHIGLNRCGAEKWGL